MATCTEDRQFTTLAIDGYDVLVDEADLHLVEKFTWNIARTRSGKRYVRSSRAGFLHRLLMNPPADLEVDHRDGNGLNNRRSNLRIATSQQNIANSRGQANSTSPYKGVHLVSNVGKWHASIKYGRHTWNLGYGDDPVALARIYDAAARLLHKEFAYQNFPAPPPKQQDLF